MDVHAQTGVKPVPTLMAGGMMLRTFRQEDGHIVVDALNDWNVTRWLTRVPFPYDMRDFDQFMRTMCNDPSCSVWAMQKDRRLIGTISLGDELGYWLHPDHHGQGLMSEAARRICTWHFDQSDKAIVSGYHLGNGPSSAILGKLGFANTRIDRDIRTSRGELVDIQRVALTRDDWERACA